MYSVLGYGLYRLIHQIVHIGVETQAACLMTDLHEVKESILSKKKVQQAQLATGDILQLKLAHVWTHQEARIIPTCMGVANRSQGSHSEASMKPPYIYTIVTKNYNIKSIV